VVKYWAGRNQVICAVEAIVPCNTAIVLWWLWLLDKDLWVKPQRISMSFCAACCFVAAAGGA
jgi:hypothetical protein